MDGTSTSSIRSSSISANAGKQKKNQSLSKVRVKYYMTDHLSLAPPSPLLLTPSVIFLFVDFSGVRDTAPSYPILSRLT